MKAPKPTWLLTYELADVSDELAEHVTSVEYTDHLKGQADELSLTVHDTDGRWREGWFPSAADRIDLKLGYEGEPLLPCGRFRVDETEVSSPPDTVSIRALSVNGAVPLRTKTSRGFELTTLRDIAALIARELELELVGDVPDVDILRSSQADETTLAYLHRLAEEHGVAFGIRDGLLTFYAIAKLEAKPAAVKLSRGDLSDVRLKAPTHETYAACEVSFLDPATKQLRKVRVEAKEVRARVLVGDSQAEQQGATRPPEIPTRTLRQGMSGDDVRAWQTFLRSQSNDPGSIDGIFGPKARAATIAFQRSVGTVQDGIAGPETFRLAVERGFGTAISPKTVAATRAEPVGNVLRKTLRVESIEQAEVKAKALLDDANRLKASGGFTTIGNVRLVAGSTLELTGMGRFDGKYLIQSSRHKMARGAGYTTSVEVTRV